MEKEKSISEIKNFALNVCNWQVINEGYYHRISIHIQNVIENFVIFGIIVDNGTLKFDGIYLNDNHKILKTCVIDSSSIKKEELEEILSILKDINFFVS